MHHEHFGLAYPPFKITPDTRFFYAGGRRGEILKALVYAITQGEGIIKVVGQVGSGKTMLCRMLEARLPRSVEIVYLANPRLSPKDILHAIALEMCLPIASTANRLQLMHALHQRLLDRHSANVKVVVFVEEGQSMPLATLEEIRLLSNLETQRDKLLQIVLFGQPELDKKLSASNIRQLKERITHSFYLMPFSTEDMRAYVNFRLQVVGHRGADIFSRAAYRRMARASAGVIRRINILADKSLLAAFAENTHHVLGRHVQAAIQDSEFERRRWEPVASIIAPGLLLIAASAGWILFSQTESPWQQFSAIWPGPLLGVAESTSRRKAVESGRHQGVATGGLAAVEEATNMEVTMFSEGRRQGIGTASETPWPTSVVPKDEVDLLTQRLEATRHWLNATDGSYCSIQLLATEVSQQGKLEEFLARWRQAGPLADIYVYKTTTGEKTWFGVLYKDYPTLGEAREALKKLPPALKRYKPFIRKIREIRPIG